MAVRDRRPAVWPWLIMPVIVLLVFYALHRVQHAPPVRVPPSGAATGTSGSPTQ